MMKKERKIRNSKKTGALVAAAPDMLEALQNLYLHCAMIHKYWGDGCNQKESDSAIAAGEAAIKKALGE
jgi:hypothetical protein